MQTTTRFSDASHLCEDIAETLGLDARDVRRVIAELVDDPAWATKYSIPDLVELTGTQGVELLMWLAARGALSAKVKKVHANYHIPISNTAAGLMVLENG